MKARPQKCEFLVISGHTVVLVKGCFYLKIKHRSSPLTPALNILALTHAGWRHLYISAWYCTDCFSACHFNKLESHRTVNQKAYSRFFPLTSSMNMNRRSLSFEGCRRHVWIMTLDYNELSWRTKWNPRFLQNQLSFILWKRSCSRWCTCALIWWDILETCWVPAKLLYLTGNLCLSQPESQNHHIKRYSLHTRMLIKQFYSF